jgi:hypothetical protein
MARGSIHLARGIHCCSAPPPARVTNILMTIHISERAEIVYELPLLPNQTASETFLEHLSVFSITTNTHFKNNFITQQLISILNSGHQHGPDTKI